MMDHSGVMQYDSRPANNALPERPTMASPYVMAHAYTMPPMTTVQASHYPSQNGFGYNLPYSTSSTNSAVRPQERHPDERPPTRLASPDYISKGGNLKTKAHQTHQARHDEVHNGGQSRSPSIKSETLVPDPKSLGPNMKEPKTIVANAPEGTAREVAFHTEVDVLMKAIQINDEPPAPSEFVSVAYPSPPRFETEKEGKRPREVNEAKDAASQCPTEKEKRYVCRIKGCGKRFSQKTHLDIHVLAHTGQRPHKCPVPGCNSYFTQKGNMRTHERRHTGEKPFKCPNCDKCFAQRSNVVSHQETHLQSKKFYCALEGCKKRFGQLGNLKNHQNKSHKSAILELTRKFSNLQPGDGVSESERELLKYFAVLYKNSNKGIKGRGKGCNVSRRAEKLPDTIPSQPFIHPSAPLQHQLPQHLPYQSHPTLPLGVNHFSVPRSGQPHNMLAPRYGRGPPYDMYDMEQGSSASSGTLSPPSSSSPGTIYEDNHTFQDRLY